MEIKITKKEILQEMDNEMCTFKEYLVHFKLLDDTRKFYKKGKFVQAIEHNEIFEYADKDYLTEQQQNKITNEILIDIISSYCENFEDTKELAKFCNDTIKEYNQSIRGFAY